MRILFIIVLASISLGAHSWECGNFDNYEQPIEDHYELASDVIFGRVTSGSLVAPIKHGYNLSFTFDILYPAKGSRLGPINLVTSPQPPFPAFELGGYYLIFLFGEDVVSFCNIVSLTGVSIKSYEELVEYSKRTDILGIKLYKKVAELANKP